MGDFLWTADKLRWMRDAANNSAFYNLLAGKLIEAIPAHARVLELGCGTGALAVALSPCVQSVTALDASALALSALDSCPRNVYPLTADAFTYAPETPFDAMILCYFARADEFLRLSHLCRGVAQLICDAKRSAAYEQALSACGVAFDREHFSLSFDQPLRSREEAARYAACYARPPAKETGDAEFPYLDAITRDCVLLRYPCGGEHETAL